MSLLIEIQSLSVSSDNRITDLLRKCKILAARLGNKDFDQWIDNELSGYKSKEHLPDYRILHSVELKGHFGGPFGSGLRNAIIAPSCFDEELREFVSSEYLMQGISTYEELLRNDSDGQFHSTLPADLIAHYSERMYENMSCLEAWKVIPRGSIVGLVDVVRNRVLSFALEIEKVNPEAGEAPLNSEPISQGSLSQIFNTHIYGNIGTYSTGNQNTNQSISIDVKGNMLVLKEELKKMGVEDQDINLLENAIIEDRVEKDKIGDKTSSWISKMISKAASGVYNISVATATQVLPKLICGYFGIK